MHEHIIQQTLIGIGITQFRFDEGIVDESTYLSKCQEVVGIKQILMNPFLEHHQKTGQLLRQSMMNWKQNFRWMN